MGNEVSSSEMEEEQEETVKERNPEFAVEAQNGPVTLQSTPTLNAAPEANHVSTKQLPQQENVIASSQKTIVFSPISNGSVSTPPPPAEKSKFRLTISRPSARTSFQPNGRGDVGPPGAEITLQPTPVVQTQLMTPIGPDSVVVKENAGGVQGPPSLLLAEETSISSANPTEEEEATTKPKEISIFHRLFKPEKKTQPNVQSEVTINQPVVITVDQTAALQSLPPSEELQSQSVEERERAESAQEQSAAEETPSNTPPAELHPVMSFFKTLVTPNKSATRSEEELKSEDKSKKDEQQTSGGKVVLEQSVVSVSVNSEKSPPEQVLILDPKSSDVPTQIPTSEGEGKAAKESASPRPKLFWRKSFKAEPQPNKIQENGEVEQAAISVSVNPTPEQISVLDTNPPDPNVQPPEEKPVMEPPSRPLPFWRKSFKGDPQPRKNQEVVVEQPVVSVSITSEKASPPEQVLPPDTKPPEPDTPQPESEKPQKEAPARPMPFWRKSFKADPPPQKVPENVVVEPPVVSVSMTSEKASPPEQVLPPDTKPPESDTPQPESEKPQKEAPARPMPFWRKSFKGEAQTPKVQEKSLPEEPQNIQLTLTSSSEPEPQTSKSNPGDKGAAPGSKTPENKKPEDGKSAKPKIMMFFKQLSVLGDGSNVSPEENPEKSNREPTLDITDGVEVSKNEKTVVTAVVEPPPPPPPLQKGKDNVKEKKASAEKLNKQESRESAEAAVSVQAPDPALADNGAGATREGQLKRTEKRQSLGSFFKAIGPKRMCDAEVQTDPVTVLPAEKTK